MGKKKIQRDLNDAYDLYVSMKHAIPDGATLPHLVGGITYLLADIFIYVDADSKQFEQVFEDVKKSVLKCMYKYRESTKQFN